MEGVWKEAFAVGTEWDQLDKVYKFPWDFSHLDEALSEGGILDRKRVYLFGCTEPQLLHWKDKSTVIHVPVVVAVTSPFPPSDKLGIKSVQRAEEEIVPMRSMKMGWVPVIPGEEMDVAVERRAKSSQVFALKCSQRKAGLRQLKEDRAMSFQYCMPYIELPDKQDEVQVDSVVDIMFTPEGGRPPVVTDFDWTMDDVDDKTEDLIKDEALLEEDKEGFKEYLRGEIKASKQRQREAREKRRKLNEDLSDVQKEGLRSMRFYKFYPRASPECPEVAQKGAYINRYYGKAHEVL